MELNIIGEALCVCHPELSMGRLDQARTRPEPGPNPKIIKNCT